MGWIFALILSIGSAAVASTPSAPAWKPQPLGVFIQRGVVTGGVSREAMSLLGVEHVLLSEGERIVLSFGNAKGLAQAVEPTFFHLAVDELRHRLVLDLSRIQKTAVDQADLRMAMAGSQLLSEPEIAMDPMADTTHLVFKMKSSYYVRALTQSLSSSQIILEIKPEKMP